MDPDAAPDQDHEPDDADQPILAALSEQPFASVRKLSLLSQVTKITNLSGLDREERCWKGNDT
jgi:hypothetical protein